MEVGGSKGGNSSLAIVFLIMLLGGPSQIIHGKYFYIHLYHQVFLYVTVSVFHFVILRIPF